MPEFSSLTLAIKAYFGNHPNGTTRFVEEFKALTDKDKAELREMLANEGFVVA